MLFLLLATFEETSETHTPLFDWFLYIVAILAVALAYQYIFAAKPTTNRTTATATSNSISSTTADSAMSTPNRTFTLAELSAYNGSDPSKPIYLGCNGLVFDVTAGRGFYGPGQAYGVFAGRDASRGLATMDLQERNTDISDLTAAQKGVMRDWSDKFHSKYPVVGIIRDTTQPNSGTQQQTTQQTS